MSLRAFISFPREISSKVNLIVQLEFKLTFMSQSNDSATMCGHPAVIIYNK